MDSSASLSVEAIENINSVYNNKNMIITNLTTTGNTNIGSNLTVSGNMIGNKLNINNDISTNGNLISKGNISTDGSITFNGNLNIVNSVSGNKFTINNIDFRDYIIGCILTSVNPTTQTYKNGANGGGNKVNLTIGKWMFCGDSESWFSDQADNVIVNPGFGVKLWTNCNFTQDNDSLNACIIENKDVKPVRITLNGTNPIIENGGLDIYTTNSNLVSITYKDNQSLQNTISSVEVYKL